MRYLVMVKGNEESESGALPPAEMFEEMGRFNAELVKAGVLLEAAGLHPSSQGMRITFSGGEHQVIDGPFTEAKELVAGFWLWETRTPEEAIEWAKRIPFQDGEVEIRRIMMPEDFGDELPDSVREQEARLRAEVEVQRA